MAIATLAIATVSLGGTISLCIRGSTPPKIDPGYGLECIGQKVVQITNFDNFAISMTRNCFQQHQNIHETIGYLTNLRYQRQVLKML